MARRRSSTKRKSCEPDRVKTTKAPPSSPGRGLIADLLKVTRPASTAPPPSAAADRRTHQSQIAFVEDVANLTKITDDGVQLAVWRNASPPRFIEVLSDPSLAPGDLPSFEGLVPALPGLVAEAMKRYMWMPYKLRSRSKSALDEEGMDELVQHVDRLVNIFC